MAIVMISGAIVGGVAILKPVACEPFGCLMGGFCFGMWMLTLDQSGVLGQEKTKNGLFLSAMSLLTVLLYFWRFTKHYAMMASSAFTGATALVLGIDFVSNAGLKEYWAWIWNLNEDIFPPDADSYPLKIGIKIEQGVTIILFVVGIAAQWSRTTTMKQQQARQELEKRAGHIAVQKADEKAGAEFERRIAAERAAFESRLLDPPGDTYQGKGSRMDNFLTPFKKGWMSLQDRGVKKEDESRDAEITPEEAIDVARADLKDTSVKMTSTGCDPIPDAKNQSRTSVQTKHDSCHSLPRNRDSGTTIARTSTAPDERELKIDEIRPAAPPKPTVAEDRNMELEEAMPAEAPNPTIAEDRHIEVNEVMPASPPRPIMPGQQDIEMDEIKPVPPMQPTAAEVVMGKDEEAGRVTIKVAVDEVELAAAARAAANPVPEVIPLPFKLPSSEDEKDEVEDDDDRSSLAVMTDGFPDKEVHETQSVHSKRDNFAKRLSTSSVEIFRRLSQHSMSTHMAKEAMEGSESTEDLTAARHGDRDSVAATFDDMSSVDENDLPAAASPTSERGFSKEIKAELAGDNSAITVGDAEEVGEKTLGKGSGEGAAAVGGLPATVSDAGEEADVSEGNIGTEASEPSIHEEDKRSCSAASDNDVGSGPGMSEAFVASAVPQTLETGKLETKVNQAVQTYRMVDWVKHQTKADEPQMDNLDLPELRDLTPARPVDVEDLVKTAEHGAPRIAKPRTASAINNWARQSAQHQHAAQQTHLSPHHGNDRTSYMTSEQRRHAEIQATAAALAGATVHKASSIPSQATTTAESLRSRPPVPGIKPCNAPQSLVAKRETMLRMKEQALRPHSVRPAPSGGSSAQDLSEPYGNVAALAPQSLISDPTSAPSSRRTSGAYRSPNMSNPLLSELDEDDDGMPLRQRQAIIRSRRSSMASTPSSGNEAASAPAEPFPGSSSASSLAVHNPNIPHSQRSSFDPYSSQKREAQLAGFRSSVQADLRASSQALPVTQPPGYGGGYRSNKNLPMQGPLIDSVYNAIPGTSSAHSLLPQQTPAWHADVSRDIELHRQSMMAQKVKEKRDADERRRELRRAERQRQSQLGGTSAEGMMDAHSEGMWRLQKKANIQ